MPLIDPVTMADSDGAVELSHTNSSAPIELLPTPLTHTITHLHPVFLVAISYFIFPLVVADPVLVLYKALPAVMVMQIGYVLTCLPAAGSTMKVIKKGSKTKPGPQKKVIQSPALHLVS
jgi:phosphatidylinositol glycan class F